MIFEAFNLAFLQDAKNLLLGMSREGLDFADLIDYLEKGFKLLSQKEPGNKPCSDCGEKMFLYPICRKQGPGNLYGYRCRWYCDNCGKEIFSKLPYAEELKNALR